MDSIAFLDAVRQRHQLPSDNKLAQFLHIPQGRITSYRTGRRKLDPDACIKVAKALELPPEHVLASIAAERAKRTEHRRIWERLAKIAKQAHVLAVVGFVGAGAVAPSPAHAGDGAQSLYILSNRRRRSIDVGIDRRWRPDRRRTSRPAAAIA
jgi:plasmid maintenance system antidote protein VapI